MSSHTEPNSATPLIVAIDGGAGTGTSTAAEGVAKALGVPHLNTGSIFRAMTWECMRQQLDLHDGEACGVAAEKATLALEDGMVCTVDGIDVRGQLYTEAVSRNTPIVAGHKKVRTALLTHQREAAEVSGGVLEGRAIGTEVFPDTPHKFFFICDIEERVRRVNAGGRHHETVKSLLARDAADEAHEHGTFKAHNDAVTIDTTRLSLEEVIQTIVDHVRLPLKPSL